MRIQFGTILATVAVATGAWFPLAGEDLAISAAFGFRLNTAKPIVVSSAADMQSLANWPVTYRAGETVTVTAPDDTVSTLAANAPTAGAAAFTPTVGGLWRLDNSNGESALVGVAWGVFGDGWSVDFTAALSLKMHTVGAGPDRRGQTHQFPSVSYSGDNWLGAAAAASTVTFIPPDGEPTTLNLTGTGITSFVFGKSGQWTVRLAMADGTTREAVITVIGGLVIVFH